MITCHIAEAWVESQRYPVCRARTERSAFVTKTAYAKWRIESNRYLFDRLSLFHLSADLLGRN
jgi:hypothetical protein